MYFIGCKLIKNGILRPTLKFPLMAHKRRYKRIPAKTTAERNPALLLSSLINKVFKKG
jgi:hypothetical protein